MSFLGLKSNSILTATAVLFFITLNVYSQNKEEVFDKLGIRENLGDKHSICRNITYYFTRW
jgi:hypothetical protein